MVQKSTVQKCCKGMPKEASPKLVCKMKYSVPLPYLLKANIFSYILTAERLALDKVCSLLEIL